MSETKKQLEKRLMEAFWDCRCVKCDRHVGWYGTPKDRPDCACGYNPYKERHGQ